MRDQAVQLIEALDVFAGLAVFPVLGQVEEQKSATERKVHPNGGQVRSVKGA